jgi:sporulation protein YlmC with PRC-barrel domain
MTATMSSTAIPAKRVNGTEVYNSAGEHLGEIEDIMIDKPSGEVIYAIMSFGGFLGIGEKFHPLPWQVLHYDTSKDGYVVDLTKEQLKKAPASARDELDDNDTAPARQGVRLLQPAAVLGLSGRCMRGRRATECPLRCRNARVHVESSYR